MLLKLLSLCVTLAIVVNGKSTGVTFQNVRVLGLSVYTVKFNITIAHSDSLKENLPKIAFDAITISNSELPVLHGGSVSDLDNLDELSITATNLQEIQPGAFQNVPELRKLTLSSNKLEEIQIGVFNHLNVATLDLSKNSISEVASGAFDNMPELLNVNLADNKLTSWNSEWFANTPLLTRVSFQNNLIQEIPAYAFKNMEGLKQFGSVPLTINLVFSHNKISKIHDDAFRDLKKINHLWVDNNEIDTWSEDFLSNIEVDDLRLNSNKLTCLPGDLEKVLVAKTTHLDGNPWDCECLHNIDVEAKKQNKDVQMFYAKLTCDASRIERKIQNLNNLLKEIKDKE